MNNRLTCFLIYTIILSITACTPSSEKPEGFSKEVMTVLKALPTSEEAYLQHFISFEDFQAGIENGTISKEAKIQEIIVHSKAQEKFDRELHRDFEKIVNKITNYRINGKKMVYEKSSFEEVSRKGMRMLEGKTYFKHNDQHFVVASISIYNGERFQLATLTNLEGLPTSKE